MIVLVTGATSGFGEAIARRFAAEEHSLILIGRRVDRLKQLVEQLDVPIYDLPLDVRERDTVAEALAELPAEFREVDVLVNNAGLALGLEPSWAADLDDWETMVDTNVKGVLYMTRAILPGMVERGRGHVINIGSTAGNWPYPGGNVYGGTKAFLKQFSLNLRADLIGTGVRVTNLEPGLAETEFSLVRYKGDADRASDVYKNVEPLVAADIAEAAFWAASQPAHVNITRIEMMCTAQANGPLALHRDADRQAERRTPHN
ncbi:MAG: SDR family oxidoreductase [Planctomycetes bacterium]|nr:SDR family oxidoreductase [Planctomycetota bacterium]